MNRFKVVITILLILLAVDTIDAQRRSRTRTRANRRGDEQKEQLATKWLSVQLGNVGFGRGFSLSSKVSAGFEFEERISIGAYGKFFYENINNFGNDINLFSPGYGATGSVLVTDEIFIQGEYSYTSFEQQDNTKDNIWYPSVGGGYKTGQGNWTYGFSLLFYLKEEARTSSFNTVEYWIDFNYKF